jgi:putative membrane protein
MSSDPLGPRVIEVDPREDIAAAPGLERAPQVLVTEVSERVNPVQPARPALAVAEPPQRRDAVISLGIAGLGLFVAGWFVVDAIGWVASAFERGTGLGTLAATAVAAGVAGAGAIIVREIRSLFRLKNVEAIQQRFRGDLDQLRSTDARETIADILQVVPREPPIERAIQNFQRQAQAHHTASQQVEILSRTVIAPLDQRAEAHVRTAVIRAFGITAISPTAVTDAAFFLAVGVRMVRGVASSYGHRPTAAATVHLLRRLLLEAGKLGAVDIASTTLMQHLGGAVTERFATSAADALYAAYRMARLGIIVMELCRPIPFREDDMPSVSSLVSNVVRRKPEEGA